MSVTPKDAAMNRNGLPEPSHGFPRHGPVTSEIPLRHLAGPHWFLWDFCRVGTIHFAPVRA